MSDTLTQVTLLGFVNAFLVREDDGLTLVDTGTGPGADKKILAAAERLGAPIRRIVITHAHSDHTGSLDKLAPRLDDVEVLVSARDARILAGDKSLDPGEQEGKARGPLPKTETQPTRTLDPGDHVGSLEVLDAKGHTVGQIALLDTRDRTLIAGDAFTTRGGVATAAKATWKWPLTVTGTWHKPTAVESARALAELNPSRLAVGHGPVVTDPTAEMQAAVARGC